MLLKLAVQDSVYFPCDRFGQPGLWVEHSSLREGGNGEEKEVGTNLKCLFPLNSGVWGQSQYSCSVALVDGLVDGQDPGVLSSTFGRYGPRPAP
jgi:hypothetical protein